MSEFSLEQGLGAIENLTEEILENHKRQKAASYGLSEKPHSVIIEGATITFRRTGESTFKLIGNKVALKDEGKEFVLYPYSDLTLTLPLIVQDP